MWAWLGLGCVLGAVLAGWWVASLSLWGALGTATLAASMLCLSYRKVWAGRLALLVVGIALGEASVASLPMGPRLRGDLLCRAEVRTAPSMGEVDVQLTQCNAPWEEQGRSHGRVRVSLPFGITIRRSDHVLLQGKGIDPGRRSVLPGAPDPVRAMHRVHIRTWVDADRMEVIGGSVQRPYRSMHGLLTALATGDRSELRREDTAVMRLTGTSHLISVSGSHVAAIAWIIWSLGQLLRGLVALKWPQGCREVHLWLPISVATALFVSATGAEVAAQRALVLAMIIGLSRAVGRPISMWDGLGIAAIWLVLSDPACIDTPSFQLSFGALAGLIGWGPVLDARLPGTPAVLRILRQGLIMSFAAVVGTLPAVAWWFQTVAPAGPIANLIAVPVTSFVLLPCGLLGAWVPGLIGDMAANFGSLAATALLALLGHLTTQPLIVSAGPLGALALCGLFWLARWPLLACCLAMAVLGLRQVPVEHALWTWPDIGQGSAALLQDGKGHAVLVDTGRAHRGLAAWLLRRGVWRLDKLVLSHPDDDHIGAVQELLKFVEIGEVALVGPGWEQVKLWAASAHVPVDTDPPRLHPLDASRWLEDNNRSLVLDVRAEGWRALLPGDVHKEAEAQLAPHVGTLDLLVLAHHGSQTSSSAALLDMTRPKIALVQCGRGNGYGHPHPLVLARLHAREIRLLRTDVLGTIQVRVMDRALQIRSWRAGAWAWRDLPPVPRAL